MKRLRLLPIALLLVSASCRRNGDGRLPDASVFVISIDTLRADHLPAYGYSKVETPSIDAFAREAVLFENAYSQVPLTLPSHVSLFTGRLPGETGVRDNIGYRLPPTADTLAKRLASRGYATGAAVSAIVLAGESGLRDGFAFYEDTIEPSAPGATLSRVQRSGDATEALLARFLDGVTGRPVFAFLHLYEPHTPYEPPEPFRSRFASPYDGEIAAADAVVGTFLARLRSKGLYDRALIVLLSDHGEGLGQHDEDEHGLFLYREVLHVPLLVKWPGSPHAKERIADPVALADVFPTVLSTVGADVPAGLAGVDLARFLDGKKPPARRIFSETAFPRLHYGWSDLASLVDDRWHYVEAPRPELYDDREDPSETRDLSPTLPPAFRAMRVEMTQRKTSPIAAPAADPERAAKLASLGYIGSRAAPADARSLPDPKDKAAVVRAMKKAYGLLLDGSPDAAADAFRALLKDEPSMADVWSGLAQACRKAGRNEEALAALKKQLELSAGGSEQLLAVATLALEMGRLDQASAHATLALEGGNALAHEVLSSIALARKDLEGAEREARAAKDSYPGRRVPLLLLARVRAKRGDLAGALATIDELLGREVEETLKPLMSLHQLRGDVLSRMDRTAEGEAEFLTEIRLFPENREAYESLAVLYASQGRGADVAKTLEALVQAVPTRPSYLAAAKVLEIVGNKDGALAYRRRAEKRFGKT